MDNGATAYGFAFVDCAALRVWVGSINDDASHAALGALLMQVCSFIFLVFLMILCALKYLTFEYLTVI